MSKKGTSGSGKTDPSSGPAVGDGVTVAPYVLKPREASSFALHQERRRLAKPLPKQILEIKAGVANLADDHPDPIIGASLTMEALGLTRIGEFTALLSNIVELTQRDKKAYEPGINQMIAQIAAMGPQDGIEAMLAMQMATIHQATLKVARSLRGAETIAQQDSASTAVNKLARTFAAQVEALKRYRSRGEQKVVVEHVTVNQGGQAIVGTVTPRGGSVEEK